MDQAKKDLGEKLRALREDYDLTQGQVAEALKIDRSTYSNYELGKSNPKLDKLVKLAHIFNVPPDTFLPTDDHSGDVSLRDVVRPSSMVKSLSKEERGMLAVYRSLTREQRRKINEEMANMAKKTGE